MADANTSNVEMEEEDFEADYIPIGDTGIKLPPPPPPACTFDSTGPRLIITHIENDFFKSYAGKQTLGPFHKSFTSIVGPNGSGKSNVIDSMLFVFGYRAQKIRSKKISVLIHNSDTHPNVQSCRVAVYFQKIIDKGDDFEVVPNSQFCVSRTAFKDNSSFYQVDGKRCQFKVAAKLLRSYGIDLDHNRFLILQGEVEQIAMMKPKAQTEHDTGMLEYLEDIVGSSRFKDPIEMLSKKVEEFNELRGEKLNRVKLVEKEKDELEEPKNEAVAHLKLENEITLKKNVLCQCYIHESEKSRDMAEGKRKEIDDGMADIKQSLAELEAVKKEKDTEMKEIRKKHGEIISKKEQLQESFRALESQDAQHQENLKHKNQYRKKLMAQHKTEQEKLTELEKVPAKNEKDIEECETAKAALEKDRKKEEEAYHKAMASLNSETQQLQDEKEKHETKLIDLRKAVDETKSALDIAQSELDIYLSTERNEKKKLQQIQDSLDKFSTNIASKKEEIVKLQTAIPDLETTKRNSQQELQELVPKLEAMEKELSSARIRLEETRSSMQSSRSKGRVLDALMEQKKKGQIPGIFGRLGDLGGIDEKYDVAISTACGPLDNIVVDCVETGQKCINFLKKNNIGSSTFIALDKMKNWRPPFQTPENVPRLFDLINIQDDNVKMAFYFSIRDTLVANDLEQATRIAYSGGRHRVVTLRGELLEASGTMSGGGKTVSRGRMGKSAAVVTVDPREVARTEANVEELTNQVTQMRRQRAQLEETLQSSCRDLERMKMNLKKFEMEVQGAANQEKTLKTQLQEQKRKVTECEPDKNKVGKMEKEIEGKSKIYQNAASKADEIEQKVNKIHAQIVEITGGKIKGMKKKLDNLNKQLEKLNAEITRLQVAIKTSKRNFKKTEDKISSLVTEIEEIKTELRDLSAKKNAIENDAGEILNNLKAITEDEAETEVLTNEKKKEFDEIIKKETEIKSRKIEFDQEIEKWVGMIKENKSKILHWKKQLGKLELQELAFENDEDAGEKELRSLDPNELEELDAKKLQYEVNLLEEKCSEARPNMAVLAEYRKKEDTYLKRVSELEEITTKRDEQRKFHEELRKQRLNEFMSGFTIISNKLKEMYQMITLGGDAELELVDSLDPFSEGIVFSVRPPKKSWKNITNLSGGEKTLSSLALVFALHYYKPTPLYVMDEIDAALDFKNVSIVGNYIKERTRNAQFIIISLRSQMFELADRLVGIYKTYNCTKSVTVNPNKFCLKPKSELQPEPMVTNQTVLIEGK